MFDYDYQNWLGSLLDVDSDVIRAALESEKLEKNAGGRKLMSQELRQDVYS